MTPLALVLWMTCTAVTGALGYLGWAWHQIRCQKYYNAGLMMGHERAVRGRRIL